MEEISHFIGGAHDEKVTVAMCGLNDWRNWSISMRHLRSVSPAPSHKCAGLRFKMLSESRIGIEVFDPSGVTALWVKPVSCSTSSASRKL
eukprot:CAMPEP_0184754954 /NCGR_PEP_ID=MMETSP0315-20130426/44897_1 /TAXON_ID=101924 /ORGANISM="Rhodosorus marinus, Strain UTEX LB 2760" /LENGTH=89 /DNA_ID=CAMNT_0027234405 /DNA_START=8 /DNA_END=277 /DNA_ORIENTATION=+